MIHLDDLTPDDRHRIRADLRAAAVGGVLAAAVMGAVVVTVGSVGSVGASQAQSLLETALATIRSFSSTAMVVTASTLALMLTILGLTSDTDRQVKASHYERIRQIALADVVAFTAATLLLVSLVVPFHESSSLPGWAYAVIYFAATGVSALIGGLVVAVMILIYAAVRDLTTTLQPGDESPLLEDDDA